VIHDISPLDGRYQRRLRHLARYFSEQALVGARWEVELAWVDALARSGLFPPLSSDETERLRGAHDAFTETDFLRIKQLERQLRHDVKACERHLVERLGLSQPHLIHFGLGTEDVNNLAYSRLLDIYRVEAQLPQLRELMALLLELVERWKSAPFPARTHGQLASPTTAGKELAVFLARLLRQWRKLDAFRFTGKLNGATGNLSALTAAFPEHEWLGFTQDVIKGLGLEPNLVTTQVEDHDTWAEYFGLVARMNTIVLDLDRDCWSYISRKYLVLRAVEGEVGSSTMPHKVNPINFENSEGNLTLSTALLHTLSDKLCCSRMQRDLSDSTVERNIGVALSHAYLALSETLEGLRKVELDRDACLGELEDAPELLAEPYQTILKTAGLTDPYELLRQATQGRKPTEADLHRLVEGLDLPHELSQRLRSLRVIEYTGLAETICDRVIDEARAALGRF
jgi:adenylosuccinate lyase